NGGRAIIGNVKREPGSQDDWRPGLRRGGPCFSQKTFAGVNCFTYGGLGRPYGLLIRQRCDEFRTGDIAMFTKTSIALTIIVAIASSAVAAQKRQHGVEDAYAGAPQITLPSTTPEGYRAGWFMDQ